MNKRFTILVSAFAMWGSVEWILPVCKYLRDNYKNVEVIFLILRKRHGDLFKDNQELKNLAKEVSSNRCYDLSDISPGWIKYVSNTLCYFNRKMPQIPFDRVEDFWFKLNWKIFGKILLRKWVARIKPDVGLMDSTTGYLFNELKKNGVKTGYYPTATSFAFSPDIYCDIELSHQKMMTHGYTEFDFFLVDTEWRSNFFKEIAGEKPVYEIGPPKFDTYWIDYCKEKTGHKMEDSLDTDYKRNILIFLKNDSSLVFDYINFEDTLNEIIRVCLEDSDVYLTIKPHPRQNQQVLEKILSQYPQNRILISNDSPFSLINRADVVISMPSGVILSPLMLRRLVIEYFNYGKLNESLRNKYDVIPKGIFGGLGSLDKTGKFTSTFRLMGLVQAADTPEELKSLIVKLNHGGSFPEVKDIRHIFPDGACRKASEVILSIA